MPFASAGVYGKRLDLAGELYDINPEQQYVATKVLPKFVVPERSGTFPRVLGKNAFRLQKTARAAGSAFGRSMTEINRSEFRCDERAWEEAVDRTERNIWRSILDQEKIAAVSAYNTVAIDHERDVRNMLFNETAFPASGTTGLTVGNAWNTTAGTPIADVKVGLRQIRNNMGGGAKVYLLANDNVVDGVWNAPNIRGAMLANYGRYIEGKPQHQVLADILGLDGTIEAPARFNSAGKGLTANMANIWDNQYAGLVVIADDLELRKPRLGATFVYGNAFDHPERNELSTYQLQEDHEAWLVEMYADNNIDSDVVRVREFTDEVIMDTGGFFLFKGVL